MKKLCRLSKIQRKRRKNGVDAVFELRFLFNLVRIYTSRASFDEVTHLYRTSQTPFLLVSGPGPTYAA